MAGIEKPERIFQMYPISFLREIAYQNQLVIKERSKNDFINKLMDHDWKPDDIKKFHEQLKILYQEKKPINHYMAKIEKINLEVVKNNFEENKAEIGSVQGKKTLISDGYEILDYEQDKMLKTKQWKNVFKRELGPFGEILEYNSIKSYEFIIDLEKNLLFINDAPFKTATSIKNFLGVVGVEFKNVGLQKVAREEANKKFKEFVQELEKTIKEV